MRQTDTHTGGGGEREREREGERRDKERGGSDRRDRALIPMYFSFGNCSVRHSD